MNTTCVYIYCLSFFKAWKEREIVGEGGGGGIGEYPMYYQNSSEMRLMYIY